MVEAGLMKESISVYTPKHTHAKTASVRALRKMAVSLNVSIINAKDLIKLSRRGLPAASFESFTKHGFTRKEMEWIIPPRTLSHRQKGDGFLSIEESDKLIRAAKIQALAAEVLGAEEKAISWLHKERNIFDGLSAMELMKTELGAQQVEDALIQLDEGFF
jgi:putative toxin-antitoxin system antitoxin component (TIGR02293 family)